MSQVCEFFDIPETPTVSIRTHVAVEGLPGLIGQSYGAIMQYMGELGEPIAGEPFVIYYNLDMKNLDVELGFPVSKSLPAQGRDQAIHAANRTGSPYTLHRTVYRHGSRLRRIEQSS